MNGKLNEFLLEFGKTVSECGVISYNSVIVSHARELSKSYYTAIDILFCQSTTSISLDFVKRKWLKEEARHYKNKHALVQTRNGKRRIAMPGNQEVFFHLGAIVWRKRSQKGR